jgi:hypothetical protein
MGVRYLVDQVRTKNARSVPCVHLQMIATSAFRDYIAALMPIDDTSTALDYGLGSDIPIEGGNNSRHEASMSVAAACSDRLPPEGQASFNMAAA